MPLIDRSAFAGTLIAEYSIEALLRYFVPAEVSRRHAIVAARRAATHVLASTVIADARPDASAARRSRTRCRSRRRGNGLMLRGQGYRTSVGLIGNTLFWMVVRAVGADASGCCSAPGATCAAALQMQSALVAETNFRRAMENSMLTGMRAHGHARAASPTSTRPSAR